MIVTVLGDHYASYRILALLCGTILLIFLNRYRNPYLLMIVGLNPLIWIYSGRSHSELLSAGLMLFALDMRRNCVFNGVLAGLAACVKYHAILVSGGYWAFIWLRDQIREGKIILRNRNFISGLVSVGFLLIFF